MSKGSNTKIMVGIYAFCLGCMGNNMTMAIIAYIMQDYSNVSTTVVQSILTMPALVAMIYAFCVGRLNRRFSTKTLLVFGQVCLFIFGMIYMVFGGRAPIYVLLAAAGLVGISQGSNYTVLGDILSGVIKDDQRRGAIFGICSALMNLGGVAFSVIGGMIAVSSWQRAYALFFFVLLTIIIEIFTLPNTRPAAKEEPTAGGEKAKGERVKMPVKVYLICINYLFWFMFLYVFGTNISAYIINTYQLGTSVEAGIATSAVTAGGVVAGALYGAYSKFTKKWTVPVMQFMTALGLFLPLVLTHTVIGAYAGGLLCGFAMSGCAPYIMTEMGRITRPEQYTQAMSYYSGVMNIGMCIAIYVIAFLTNLICGDGSDIHTRFLVGCVGALICAITAIPIYLGKDKPVEAEAQS